MLEIGKPFLILCGRAFAFVGVPVEQTGPYTWRLREASMLCRTGGVPWDELADGKRRELATFRFHGEVTVGPFFSFTRPWHGPLPGPDHTCRNLEAKP